MAFRWNPKTGGYDEIPDPDTPVSGDTAQPSPQQASFQVGATGVVPNNWVLPVAGMTASNWSRGSFGYQKPASKGGHRHEGTDIYMPRGSSVVAPVGGTVIAAGHGDVAGHYVRVRGNDGVTYYFAHLDQPPNVSRGMQVGAGNHLGFVGNSGNARGTDTHLHFKMSRGSKAISPNDFLATGKAQKFSGMDSIAGINTVEEMQAWIAEQSAIMANVNAQYKDRNMAGLPEAMAQSQFATGVFTDEAMVSGQQVLGNTLDNLSRNIAGGQRVPIPLASGQPDTALQQGNPLAAAQSTSNLDTSGQAEVGVSEMREPNPEQGER